MCSTFLIARQIIYCAIALLDWPPSQWFSFDFECAKTHCQHCYGSIKLKTTLSTVLYHCCVIAIKAFEYRKTCCDDLDFGLAVSSKMNLYLIVGDEKSTSNSIIIIREAFGIGK